MAWSLSLCAKLARIDGRRQTVKQWERRPLTLGLPLPIATGVSRPDGRSGKGRKAAGEESPGSTDVRCRITSGGLLLAVAGTRLRDSATENRPPRRVA